MAAVKRESSARHSGLWGGVCKKRREASNVVPTLKETKGVKKLSR